MLTLAACGGGGTEPADGASDPETVTSSSTTAPSPTTTGAAGGTGTEPSEQEAPPASTTTTAGSAASGPSERIQAINDRGTLLVGLTGEAPPFRSFSGEGFELTLVEEVAARLAPGTTVEFVAVTPSNRFISLAVGDIDVLVGSTHTISREQEAAFSQPYLVSGLVALVSEDAGIVSIADLAGTSVALPDGRIEGRDMSAALDAANVSYTAVTVQAIDQALQGIRTGEYSATPLKWAEAVFRINSESGLTYVPVDVLANPLGFATPLQDTVFAQEVSTALQAVIDDGTWQALFEQWIGGSPPWTLTEMMAVPAS